MRKNLLSCTRERQTKPCGALILKSCCLKPYSKYHREMMVKLPQLVFSTLFFNCNRSFFSKSYLRESYLPFMVNKRGKPLKAKIALICFNNAKPTKKKSTCILKMWFHFHRHYYEKVINKFKKKMVKKKKKYKKKGRDNILLFFFLLGH